MSTCNRLDLQALGSQPVMPKNPPDHCHTLCSLFVELWGVRVATWSVFANCAEGLSWTSRVWFRVAADLGNRGAPSAEESRGKDASRMENQKRGLRICLGIRLSTFSTVIGEVQSLC